MHKSQPKALGIAIGVTWGLGLFLLGVIASFSEYGEAFVFTIGSVYVGYDDTFLGAIAGGIWGLIDGFIAGYIVGWIYNRVLKSESA